MSNKAAKPYLISLTTAIAIVVANMVGQGVFTSLGFQVLDLKHGFTIVALWLLGGMLALFGSFAYGELGASLPRSGGEYNFLSRIYNPATGFLAGWVSLTVGFAAPVAAAALALGDYTTNILSQYGVVSEIQIASTEKAIALFVVVVISIIHLSNLKAVSIFQQFFTAFKVILIAGLIIIGFAIGKNSGISFAPTKTSVSDMFTMPFAVSLLWVMYAYSGWNASAYIVEELRDPGKNLPRSLFVGTMIVTVLYVFLNMMFLYVAPISELMGQKDVGSIAAQHLFGNLGAAIVSGLIAFALISSISSMTWAGPRVSMTIGQDMKIFSFLSVKNKHGIPYLGIIFQLFLILIMVIFTKFKDLVEYTSVLLSLFGFLAVLGVFILRFREPKLKRPYKAWGYPVTPTIFLVVMGWMMVYFIKGNTKQLIAISITLGVGLLVYFLNKYLIEKKDVKS